MKRIATDEVKLCDNCVIHGEVVVVKLCTLLAVDDDLVGIVKGAVTSLVVDSGRKVSTHVIMVIILQ